MVAPVQGTHDNPMIRHHRTPEPPPIFQPFTTARTSSATPAGVGSGRQWLTDGLRLWDAATGQLLARIPFADHMQAIMWGPAPMHLLVADRGPAMPHVPQVYELEVITSLTPLSRTLVDFARTLEVSQGTLKS